MKIILITSLYKPYMRGGTERAVQLLIDELKKKHSVSLITSASWEGFRSLLPKKTVEDGIEIYRLYPLNVFSFISINRMPWLLRFFWHAIDMFNIHSFFVVRSVLKKEKPDLVWTHNLKGIGYTVPAAIKSLGVRHIHTLHDIQLLEPSGLLMVGEEKKIDTPSFFSKYYRACTRYLFGSPSVVVFPSRFLHTISQKERFFPYSHTCVIQNPISTIPEKTFPEKPSSPVIFFYFGQLEPHKGVRVFLDAIGLLKDPDMKFIFAGKGSLTDAIRDAAKKDTRIEYKGFLLPDALREVLLREAHFSVLPTQCYENSPMSVIESLASGVPVIVSDIGGTAEHIQNQKNGYVVSAGDTQQLIQAITRARTLEGYDAMQKYAISSVATFTSENYVDTIFTLL
ncbi:MAG: glycosyltransferase [bacterium]|nr:glycosyltransferase [bacterium]